jgi:BlaI family transcriptional regulator, penicillinase repressor
MPKRTTPPPRILTALELAVMVRLWDLGEATAARVQEALAPERPLAYTTVSTVLRILEQKGVVTSRKEGRGHVYVPRLARVAYERAAVRQVVGQVFGGERLALVRRLFEDHALTDDELQALRELITGRKGR